MKQRRIESLKENKLDENVSVSPAWSLISNQQQFQNKQLQFFSNGRKWSRK